MKKLTVCLALMIAALVAAPAMAQHSGGGEEGGSGCGDVLGDLVHILRAGTGQPILARRWVSLKGGGYGWDYCPIAVDKNGQPIPFVALSCDPYDPTGTAVVPVDYFGRLSGGRTKERNSRMHFNEVISNIKDPATMSVGLDEPGRLLLGYGCASPGATQCAEWAVIDSPMENLALYTRLMKYGHFQTDPAEEDKSAHGDPTTLPQYHPALEEADWAKFQPSVRHLLPGNGESFGNTGVSVDPEPLDPQDFVVAGASLGGAANKTGKITVDLVQYMNRILKITQDTEISKKTVDTLPAIVRDCWTATSDPVVDPLVPVDPPYDLACADAPAAAGLPRYSDSTAVRELFVDFADASYTRAERFVKVIGPVAGTTPQAWLEVDNVSLMSWLSLANGEQLEAVAGLSGFVSASSDALRSVEFVHNYAIPVDLGLDFVPDTYKVTVKDKTKK